MSNYGKQKISLRYWLLGRGYHMACEAMEFAEQHHTGTRKDGVTPEFAHQVSIAHHLRTIADQLRYPEQAIAVGLLHDVSEDYGVTRETLERLFGAQVAEAVDCMTKEFNGVRRDDRALFQRIAGNETASVVKPADRVHNQNSMVGVFSAAKIREYVEETETLFVPMLKAARRTFPHQEAVYENFSLLLRSQLNLISHLRP